MGRYRIRVVTGAWLFSGSLNRVELWLVGAHREVKLELPLRPARGKVSGQELGSPQCPGWAWEVGKGQETRGCDLTTAVEFHGGRTPGVRSTAGLGGLLSRTLTQAASDSSCIKRPRADVNTGLVVSHKALQSSSTVGAQRTEGDR